MLAVMDSNPESTDPVMEFLVTGRTGRRNAMADILGPHATVTSGDLPEKLQSLSTADKDAEPSSSSPVAPEGGVVNAPSSPPSEKRPPGPEDKNKDKPKGGS